jgi:hypothetical protein
VAPIEEKGRGKRKDNQSILINPALVLAACPTASGDDELLRAMIASPIWQICALEECSSVLPSASTIYPLSCFANFHIRTFPGGRG